MWPNEDRSIDAVARDAARRVREGRATDERRAVAEAAAAAGVPVARVPLIRVRRHLEAMEQQSMGAAAWRADRHARWEAVEELLTLLEEQVLGERLLLVGRAAAGHLTGHDPIRLRWYSDGPVRRLADALELGGIEDIGFETEDTIRGRFDAVRCADEIAGDLMIVRLPTARWGERDRNLFRDERVPILDLAGLRRRLAEADAGDGAGTPAEHQSGAEAASSSSSAKEG